jgi:hypothetical protein
MTKALLLEWLDRDGTPRSVAVRGADKLVVGPNRAHPVYVPVLALVSARIVDPEAEEQARAERARLTAYYPDNDDERTTHD